MPLGLAALLMSILIPVSVAVLAATTYVLLAHYTRTWPQTRFDARGRHCLVTGGSLGLGKALAGRLLAAGAKSVVVLARNEKQLQEAVDELSKLKANPDQHVGFVSCDVTSYDALSTALLDFEAQTGSVPEYVFCCAGSSKPGFFLAQEPSVIAFHNSVNYMGAAYTAHVAGNAMVENKIKGGKLVFVGSAAGFLGITGYASYGATKAALRSLADTLRQEFLLYGIDVHLFAPGTIFSPGYAEEEKTKPRVTKQIEGEGGLTPDECSDVLMQGLERGEYTIVQDVDGMLLRAITRGLSFTSNWARDSLFLLVGWLIGGFYTRQHDALVVAERRRRVAETGHEALDSRTLADGRGSVS